MRPIRLIAPGLALVALASGAAEARGLATRDMNPMLQPVYLPGYFSVAPGLGWRSDYNLYITNTQQLERRGREDLIIDVENLRFEFDLGYRHGDWVYRATVPFVSSSAGELDQTIEDWHDFWGFPQGTRDDIPRDRIEIEYFRDGELVYSQTASSNGLGDIALAAGYQPAGGLGYFVGVDLPTGDADDFSGNDSIDVALWLIGEREVDENLGELLASEIWFAQLGLEYAFNDTVVAVAQLELHSSAIRDSRLDAFGESLQLQLGLGFDDLVGKHRLDLFFSEDIAVGTAPDITMGARLTRQF